ncbi:hypothetical protein HBZS_112130 [Helicobacter bizzozeronii CCUG 35545]|nr:hypothetical protein HBZS_112130 [Helicobacter bizzozeronii CCUG 35545]
MGAKEIHALLDTLALHPRNALIIEFYQAKDKSSYAQDFKQFATQFKHPKLGDRVIDVRFFMPNLDTLLELLQEKVHALGLSIDTPALLLLLEVQNNDVRIIYQDLEKLALLGKPIGVTEVQEHVYGLMGVETQELLEAIFEKPQKSLRMLCTPAGGGGNGTCLGIGALFLPTLFDLCLSQGASQSKC